MKLPGSTIVGLSVRKLRLNRGNHNGYIAGCERGRKDDEKFENEIGLGAVGIHCDIERGNGANSADQFAFD